MALARSEQTVLEVYMYVLGLPGGLSDDAHRRDPGGTWVWFISEATALREEGGVPLLPVAEYKVRRGRAAVLLHARLRGQGGRSQPAA